MLKTAALILVSATLGMGGAVALILSHGVQQDRLASRQASPKPDPAPGLPPQPVVAALQKAPQIPPAAPASAAAEQPGLPRLLPRPRPARPETLPAAVAGADLPRLTISSQSAAQPFAFAAPSAAPLPSAVAEMEPATLPPRAPSLLNAEGHINYNPWKTGVYR